MFAKNKTRMFSLVAGLIFLYAPIIYLIIYSFNSSRLLGAWQGFSTRWYTALFQNDTLLDAVWTSLQIAATAATVAVILGTLTAIVTVRFGRFRGRVLLKSMVTAPLVMPEVITGLALLLLFVSCERVLGWPAERGKLTVILAHVTVTTAYVYLLIQARLRELDKALEEAAMDLGAKPAVVFWQITMPLITPSLLAGWLLAFALSLDDVVIASFLSGPGSTTLPMLIFSGIRIGISPEINALATIIVGIISLGVMISGFFIYRYRNIAKPAG